MNEKTKAIIVEIIKIAVQVAAVILGVKIF